jgi:hypothetical protein
LSALLSGRSNLSVATGTNSRFSSGMVGDVSGFGTQCPYGFVVPDDVGHPRNEWISGSGCAQPCR